MFLFDLYYSGFKGYYIATWEVLERRPNGKFLARNTSNGYVREIYQGPHNLYWTRKQAKRAVAKALRLVIKETEKELQALKTEWGQVHENIR